MKKPERDSHWSLTFLVAFSQIMTWGILMDDWILGGSIGLSMLLLLAPSSEASEEGSSEATKSEDEG